MKFLKNLMANDPSAAVALSCIKNGETPIAVSGLANVHKALLAGSAEGRKIIITPDEATATELVGDLQSLGFPAALYPVRDLCFADSQAASKEYEFVRVDTLSKVLDGQISLLVLSVEAAIQFTVPPEILKQNTLTLSLGIEFPPEQLTERLLNAGYKSCLEISGTGQFSRRGGIFDVYPVNSTSPVRIEFWGDEIDSISEFDISNQRRTNSLEQIKIIQAGEIVTDLSALSKKLTDVMLSGKKGIDIARLNRDISALNSGISFPLDRYLPYVYKPTTVFDYMPEATVFAVEYSDISLALEGAYKRMAEDYSLYFSGGFILPGSKYYLEESELKEHFSRAVFLENFPRTEYPFTLSKTIAATYRRLPAWKGDISVLLEDTRFIIEKGGSCVILAGGEKAARVIAHELEKEKLPVTLDLCGDAENLPKGFTVMCGGISGGFQLTDSKFICITVAEKLPFCEQ